MLKADELIRRLLEGHHARATDIRGCTDEQIQEIESAAGVTLPLAYKHFLKAVGRGPGEGFMEALGAFYPEVIETNAHIKSQHFIAPELPAKAFVFDADMNDSFAYFVADGTSDDPPVYCFTDVMEEPKLTYRSVWDLYEAILDQMDSQYRAVYGRDQEDP